jgi:hypothetical protein
MAQRGCLLIYSIVAGLAVLVALVALFGRYRHKLELEGQRIAATVRSAQRSLAEEDEKKSS